MRNAWDVAFGFCKSDLRGGTKPIIDHQAVSDRLSDAKMKIEAARALTWKALGALESKDESLSWEQRLELALQAKIFCGDMAVGVVEACISVVGM